MQATLKQRVLSLVALVAIVGSALVVFAKADDADAALKWREEVKTEKVKTDKVK